ncbi:MAG: NADH-quinone oxidoreductase subunit NuoF [bacterium]
MKNKINSLEGFDEKVAELKKAIDPNKITIRICMTGCLAYGAQEVRDRFVEELQSRNLTEKVSLIETGCFGFCSQAPVIAIELDKEIFYQKVQPDNVPTIIDETVLNRKIISRLVYQDSKEKKEYPYLQDIPFYKHQTKLVLKNCGRINPTDITHYLREDGFSALAKVIREYTPEQVIEIIKASELRGRGGGGFPTGFKWQFCRQSNNWPKYIICNADEGDPGAFMDRAILEGDPYAVIEGMLIAAYAIGAEHGYVYVRAEYPIAIKHLKSALSTLKEWGLLGERILGADFNFDLIIKEGAGAFVCGEETALIASIEGKRGMPRPRPPFPAHKGVWGKPTNINNVETFANVPIIIREGAKRYASIGTENNRGTKVFALAGKIKNTGLVEVALGTPIRKVVYDIGGGVPRGRTFKAVQLGGPSGGCVPAEHLDVPIDYDSLVSIGAIMGSGGMIVMDDKTSMVDIARYFLDFIQSESCGKCVPCRIGTKRMLEILNRIIAGEGKLSDIDTLLQLSTHIKDTALCGLGQTAPNPVLSTIRYFRKEYEDSINEQAEQNKVERKRQ